MFFILLIFSYECSKQDHENNSDKDRDKLNAVHLSKINIFENSDNSNSIRKHWKHDLKEKYLREIAEKSHEIIQYENRRPALENSYIQLPLSRSTEILSNQNIFSSRVEVYENSCNKSKNLVNNNFGISQIKKTVLGFSFKHPRKEKANEKDIDKKFQKIKLFIDGEKVVNPSLKNMNNNFLINFNANFYLNQFLSPLKIEKFKGNKNFSDQDVVSARNDSYLGDEIFDMYHDDLKISVVREMPLKMDDDYYNKNSSPGDNSQLGYNELHALLKLTLHKLERDYNVNSEVFGKKTNSDSFNKDESRQNTYKEEFINKKNIVEAIKNSEFNIGTKELEKMSNIPNKHREKVETYISNYSHNHDDLSPEKKYIEENFVSLDSPHSNIEKNILKDISKNKRFCENIELMKIFFEVNIDDESNYSIDAVKPEFHILCILFPEYIFLFYKMKKVFKIAMDNKIDIAFMSSKFEKNDFLSNYYSIVREVKNNMNYVLDITYRTENIDEEMKIDEIISFIPKKEIDKIKTIKKYFIKISDRFFPIKTKENYFYALEKDIGNNYLPSFFKTLYNINFFSVLCTKNDHHSFNLLDKQRKHTYKNLNLTCKSQVTYLPNESSTSSKLNENMAKTSNIPILSIFKCKNTTEALIERSKKIGKIITSIFKTNYEKYNILEKYSFKIYSRYGKCIIYNKNIAFCDVKKIFYSSNTKKKWKDGKIELLKKYKNIHSSNDDFLLCKPNEFLDIIYDNILYSLVIRGSNVEV